MPHPSRRPNQTERVYEEEDYAEYDKRGFEQPFAGAVVHLGSPTFNEGDKADLRFAGWQRSNLAPAQLWITVPPNAARHPSEHRSLIWFTIWSSIVHALIMAGQSISDAHEMGHLLGDVPALLLVAVVLWLLLPSKQAHSQLRY